MSFGDFLWSLLIIYFIFFYFMLLFRIVGDLITDDGIGGLAKTGWIVVLLFLPFLSMFMYLILRGRAMTERALARSEAAEASQRDYIRRTAAETVDDPTSRIAKAHDLLSSGAITQPEFDRLKATALA